MHRLFIGLLVATMFAGPLACSEARHSSTSAPRSHQKEFRFVPHPDLQAGQMLRRADREAAISALGDFAVRDEPVPAMLHFIETLQPSDEICQARLAWQSYAANTQWQSTTWSTTDVLDGTLPSAPVVLSAIEAAERVGRQDVARHLVGLAALAEHGGVWVGDGVLPPQAGTRSPVALSRLFPLRGVLLTTNLYARQVYGLSAYITTAFMAASQDQGWVRYAAEAAAENTLHLLEQGEATWPVRYYAGNALLSRDLPGTFHVAPLTYLQTLQMVPSTFKESAEDALD